MHKLLTMLIFLLGLSCGTKEADPPATVTLEQKAQLYRTGSTSLIPRCDGATFLTHASSIGIPQDIAALEKQDGRIERDVAPCYPNDSKSEASLEMYIGWLHSIWTNRDGAALDRLIQYGQANGWVMGEGPDNLGLISQLVPIITLMDMSLNGQALTMPADVDAKLEGFRGHVLASYLWLWARVTGRMGPVGIEAIHQLVQASPADPMYLALVGRFQQADQAAAIKMLEQNPAFPADKIPDGVGTFGWGSCPDWLSWLMTLKIVQGA